MAFGAALLIVGALAVSLMIWRLRDIALADAELNTSNLSLVLSQQIARSLQTIDLVLQHVVDEIEASGAGTPDQLHRAFGLETEQHHLRDELARVPQADVISLVTAAGRILVSSGDGPPVNVDLSERDYFRHLRDTHDPHAFLGLPARSKLDGKWMVFLARRISGPDGTFLGLAVAGIHMDRLQEIFSPLRLPQAASLLLLRTDGVVLVRHPDTTTYSEERMPARSEWFSLVAKGGGHYRSPGFFDGLARQVTVRLVPDFPLVVDVSVAEYQALAQWRSDAWLICGISGGMAAALLLLFAALLRQLHLRKASERALSVRNTELHDSQLALSERSRELTTTLEYMGQGLIMVDRDQRVAVCNRLATNLLEVPPELMEARPTLDDVLAFQWEHQPSVRGGRSLAEFLEASRGRRKPYTYERSRPDGTVIEVHSVPLDDGGLVRTYTDITSRKEAERQMRYLAGHDALTGLINRMSFSQHLASSVKSAVRAGDELAVLYLDLDAFKAVNDTSGHAVGDKLLTQAAHRMRSAVRSQDIVARLGGDEFAIIAPELDGTGNAQLMAARLVQEVGEPYVIDGAVLRIGLSIGIAIYPSDTPDPDLLVHNADAALYSAKRGGRNGFRLYGEMMDAAPRHTQLT